MNKTLVWIVFYLYLNFTGCLYLYEAYLCYLMDKINLLNINVIFYVLRLDCFFEKLFYFFEFFICI